MTGNPVFFALTALLMPAASFLIIGALPPLRRAGRGAAALRMPAGSFVTMGGVPPLRRAGRVAAWFSSGCALVALVAAVLGWRAFAAAGTAERLRGLWCWLRSVRGPRATVGVLVDAQSTTMLLLVTLVALLVQVYSTC